MSTNMSFVIWADPKAYACGCLGMWGHGGVGVAVWRCGGVAVWRVAVWCGGVVGLRVGE